jgi:hypothetical protein
MSMTILVPNYVANRAIPLADGAIAALGFDMEFDHTAGLDVIVIKGRIEELPSSLRIVKFSKFIVVKSNSPLTKAVDGLYHEIMSDLLEIHMLARVETYVRSGVLQQHIRAWGTDLNLVNVWFDELVAGKKNEFCVNPVSMPEQPLSLQVLQVRDAALQKVEEMLKSDLGRYEDLNWLERDLKEIEAILAGQPKNESSAAVNLKKARDALTELRANMRLAPSIDSMEKVKRSEEKLWSALGLG